MVNNNNLCPGLKLHLSEETPDPSTIDPDGQKVDGALFNAEDAPTDGRPHWADQLVAIEFKRGSKELDPFEDYDLQFKTIKPSQAKVRGQVASYADLIFNIQHRTFLIMLLVMGRRVRVLRWDRSGVATTPAIDYVLRWEWFCEVLWRISVLAKHAPECLGQDPTAVRIRNKDPRWKIMEDAALERDTDVDAKARKLQDGDLPDAFTWKYVRTLFRMSLVKGWPRFELAVPDANAAGGRRKFLVCRPYFSAKGVIGRGTRGYAALDMRTGEFTWLKDAWRADYKGVDKEGDILAKLNEAEIESVPTLVCHGDVNDHTTLTPALWDVWQKKVESKIPTFPKSTTRAHVDPLAKPLLHHTAGEKRKHEDDPEDEDSGSGRADEDSSDEGTSQEGKSDGGEGEEDDDDDDVPSRCPHRLHRHYRIVVKEVCMSLQQFIEPLQLVSVIADCISGE